MQIKKIHKKFMIVILAMGIVCAHTIAMAVTSPKSNITRENLQGTLYEMNSNQQKLLYKYEKEIVQEANKRLVHCRYLDDKGKVIVEEKIEYDRDGNFAKYWRMQNQIQEETKMERQADKIVFYKSEKGKKEPDESETWQNNFFVTDQISSVIRRNWDNLLAGKSIDIRVMIPSRRETVGFSVEKSKISSNVQGTPSLVFELSASSMIIRAIMGRSVYFYFEKDGAKRLLMVDGRTPVKKFDKSGDYSDLDAQLVFHYDDRNEKKIATRQEPKLKPFSPSVPE